MKGKLIVITGLDGSGTTTLARNLHELDKGSHLLRTPDFPFDQGRELIDSLVREKSQPAHYLYYLSSVIHASARIEEMLKTGNVYCVRYLIDTVVSHRVAGLDVDMIYNGGLELIGNTPILKVNNLINDENMADVYVKLEKFNPGGSVKDRAALGMIEKAEKEGILKEGSVIVEPTRGTEIKFFFALSIPFLIASGISADLP